MNKSGSLRHLVRGIRKQEAKLSLLYRMARHMRGTDKMEPVQWGLRAIDLLIELREIDPDTYEREVRKQPTQKQS